MKAFNKMMPDDRRRRRSMVLLSAIMQIVHKHVTFSTVERNIADDIHHQLLTTFLDHGVEIITDADRAEAGLPPRGREGWTGVELCILEHARLSAMMAPIVVHLPKESVDGLKEMVLLSTGIPFDPAAGASTVGPSAEEHARLKADFEIVRKASRLFEDAANQWMARALAAEEALAASKKEPGQ